MQTLQDAVDAIAHDTGFSGVVRVDRSGGVELAQAYGLADRAHGIPNTIDTRFAIASGTKGLTALTVVSLIEDGTLELTTTARSVLGDDLPLIDDGVTVEHLLAAPIGHRRLPRRGHSCRRHRLRDAGAGARARRRPSSTSRCSTATPPSSPPGERFAYCNGGFVVLALIAERASGVPFHELVRRRVCEPAGDGRHRVPALRRAAGRRRARLPRRPTARGRTCCTCRCAAAATAGSTRPPPTCARSGARCSPGGSCSARLGRRDGAAAQRRAGGVEALRPRLLAPRVERRRDAGGLRRRRLVPQRARPGRGSRRTP